MANITNTYTSTNPYLYGASADVTNTPTLYAPAELGVAFYNAGIRYQRVQIDSGATAATPVGAVAANQTAYWVARGNKVVTNDKRFAGAGSPNTSPTSAASASASRNFIAGIFRVAGTPGNYVDILQKSNGVPVASDGAGAIGDLAVSDQTAATARVTAVAAGTAPGVQVIGLIRLVAGGGNITVDVDIPSSE